ncbi:MAG: hypothetical protein RLZZ292_398 [Bacteroidota bacterium]|jgi:uncharacterized RDD family membrane protein YckC
MRTVEITTTQNVAITYELASVSERIAAYLLDLFIVFGVYILLCLTLGLSRYGEWFGDSSHLIAFFVYLFPLALFFSYHLLMEGLASGQSLGKKAIGIRVLRADGKEATFSDYLLRAILQLLDIIFTTGMLAILLISSTQNSQRLGDMAANTLVVRLRAKQLFQLSDILKIEKIENYQPQYPQVRQLREQDMLLIKSVLLRARKYPNKAHLDLVSDTVHHLVTLLEISTYPKDNTTFLMTLIRDYIVLTR